MMDDVGSQIRPADKYIVRAFFERTKEPGVFHPCYPECAPDFVFYVMARAVQLQASEGEAR